MKPRSSTTNQKPRTWARSGAIAPHQSAGSSCWISSFWSTTWPRGNSHRCCVYWPHQEPAPSCNQVKTPWLLRTGVLLQHDDCPHTSLVQSSKICILIVFPVRHIHQTWPTVIFTSSGRKKRGVAGGGEKERKFFKLDGEVKHAVHKWLHSTS